MFVKASFSEFSAIVSQQGSVGARVCICKSLGLQICLLHECICVRCVCNEVFVQRCVSVCVYLREFVYARVCFSRSVFFFKCVYLCDYILEPCYTDGYQEPSYTLNIFTSSAQCDDKRTTITNSPLSLLFFSFSQ